MTKFMGYAIGILILMIAATVIFLLARTVLPLPLAVPATAGLLLLTSRSWRGTGKRAARSR